MRCIHPWNFITVARIVLEICSGQRSGHRPPAIGDPIIRPVFDGRIKMGHVGSKTRSLGQILQKFCVRCRGHIFSQIHIKMVRIDASIKSWTSSKLRHVGSKTRSLGQILKKPCIRSRGHIFSLILMIIGQNVCLDEISDGFENGSCRSKTRSQDQILGASFLFWCSWNLVRMFVLMKSRMSLKIGHVRSKTRLLCQILEKNLVYALEATFSDNHETSSTFLSWWNLAQIEKWVLSGQKLGH